LGGDARGTVSCRGVPLADLTYTVVDVETTGLKPQGNGITEVCCLRVEDGQVVDRFSSLVNPGRPIPPFIQSMTGITDAMVREAPAFQDIAPSLLEFLGDTVLVAHNAPFDLSFLNHGLYRGGYRNLHNPVVDTCRLSRRLLPGLPRASLDAVVQHLGITVQHRHRADGDAEATVQVLLRLLALCQEQGISSDVQLLEFLASARPVGRSAARTRREAFAVRLSVLAKRCRSLPDAPGVYLMRSGTGRVLYVGKAVSLRRRLASYFNNGSVPPKIKRMLGQVETIEHRQLGSELEALLEESRLIKHYQPPFNTLLRSYRDYPFIKCDESGRYPRLVVTREVDHDGALYFGPFCSVQGTELALSILVRCFRLFDGRCPERSRGESCIYRQMGRCLAPCLGPEQEARHRQVVEEVCRLLEGAPEDLVSEMVRRRDAAAERLDYETAAFYRDGIDAFNGAVERRRLLAPAVEGLNILAVCPSLHSGWVELFLFGEGRLAARARLCPTEGELGRSSVEGLLKMARRWSGAWKRGSLRIDAESLDQVCIISGWLERQGTAATTIVVEPEWVSDRLDQTVERVMAAARAIAGTTEQAG